MPSALTDLPDVLPDSVHTPARPITFLLWSHEHRMWWRADARGYTPNQDQAGRYSLDEAVHWVVQSAHCGNLSLVTSMVAAPENWSRT